VHTRRAVRSGGSAALNRSFSRRGFLAGTTAAAVTAGLAACGGRSSPVSSSADSAGTSGGSLTVGAIPDQDPEVLQRLYGTVAASMTTATGLTVTYRPVTDYGAAVSLFRTGDLDMVWFGGLTGVQARLQTPGAQVIAQRDIDESFHSLFIVNKSTGLAASDDLRQLADLRFTYGSQTSTSGFLMPVDYLSQQKVEPRGFPGGPGYSGSHDATLQLVASGSYQAGVLNEQVWNSRNEAGTVDPAVPAVLPDPGVPRLPLGAGTKGARPAGQAAARPAQGLLPRAVGR
jgi:phosphonate transport system substrate-binding protein